jgi:hypothetical protein
MKAAMPGRSFGKTWAALMMPALLGAALPLRAQLQAWNPGISIQTVATGLAVAGDIAVDGAGNLWIVEVQGGVGVPTGRLTLDSSGGAVTAGAIVGFPEISDLARGPGGDLHCWLNVAPGQILLGRIAPAGQGAGAGPFAATGRAAAIAPSPYGGWLVGFQEAALGVWWLAEA